MDLASDKTVRAALRQFKVKGGGGTGGPKKKPRPPAEDDPGWQPHKHGNRRFPREQGPKKAGGRRVS